MSSLSESFEQKYSGGRSGYQSPDSRPENIQGVLSLSPRWQRLWMMEELFDVRLEIWSKNRAKLNMDDIETLFEAALEQMDAVPVVLEEVMNQCSS